MKRLLVANFVLKRNAKEIESMLQTQIDNILDLGYTSKDIILISNKDIEYNSVKSLVVDLYKDCPTGSKMFALEWLYNNNLVTEVIHSGDLDVWQNVRFDEPEFKDVGIAQYSNKKFNGGSVFWKPSAVDIATEICNEIRNNKEAREEPTLNKILKSDKYKDRVTVLNNTYNVGCSGFVVRYERSIKPVKILHHHPLNRIAWETHAIDRNDIGEVAMTVRLERLIRKHYPFLATKCVIKKLKVK
jgi:hypothetical protein